MLASTWRIYGLVGSAKASTGACVREWMILWKADVQASSQRSPNGSDSLKYCVPFFAFLLWPEVGGYPLVSSVNGLTIDEITLYKASIKPTKNPGKISMTSGRWASSSELLLQSWLGLVILQQLTQCAPRNGLGTGKTGTCQSRLSVCNYYGWCIWTPRLLNDSCR